VINFTGYDGGLTGNLHIMDRLERRQGSLRQAPAPLFSFHIQGYYMRKAIVIVVILVVLGAAGAYVFAQQNTREQADFEILRQAEVRRDTIQATVSATGSIEPEALVSLTFGTTGTVQQLDVVRGQQVQAGDVLATLNSGELALLLQQAQDSLRIQELTLAQRVDAEVSEARLAAAQADVDAAAGNLAIAEANVEAAQAAVSQAQAQVAQLTAGANPGEIASAEANIAARRAEFLALRTQYDQLTDTGIGGAPEENLRRQRDAAESALTAAEAQLASLQSGARPADLQAAYASVASAQANVASAEGNVLVAQANLARAEAAYAQLLEPATEAEIAVLEAQVEAARTNVELAELRLRQAIIEAPIDGKVANILVAAGEQATPGAPAIVLVNEEAYHIEVSVDEIDIDEVAIGQPVEITLDALDNLVVPGQVADIAPTAVDGGIGVVTYLVTINIDAGEMQLRPGMTANASIVVREVEDVLIVPNWAVRLDRESGAAFVNRLRADGSVEEVPVEIGLRNEQFSQLVSGLAPGDVVVVTDVREGFNFFGGF
jgi:HlyD family secretion protein